MAGSTKVIGFMNQKGGVGKSTALWNLSGVLKDNFGRQVLNVEMDPQGSLRRMSFGADFKPLQGTSYDLLTGGKWQPYTPEARGWEGCPTVPSTLDLAEAELSLSINPTWGLMLKKQLDKLRGEYDYIFLDTSPSLGALATNVIFASDGFIVPSQVEEESYRGVEIVLNTIARLRETNPRSLIVAVQPTQVAGNAKLYQDFLTLLKEEYGELVSDPVKKSVRYSEAASERVPIHIWEPTLAAPWNDLAQRVERWAGR